MLEKVCCDAESDTGCSACYDVDLLVVSISRDPWWSLFVHVRCTFPAKSGISLFGSNLLPVMRCLMFPFQ